MASIKAIMAARRKALQAQSAPEPATSAMSSDDDDGFRDDSSDLDSDDDRDASAGATHSNRHQTPSANTSTGARRSKRQAARRGDATTGSGDEDVGDEVVVELDDDDDEVAVALREAAAAGAASAERQRTKRAKSQTAKSQILTPMEKQAQEAALKQLQKLQDLESQFLEPDDAEVAIDDDEDEKANLEDGDAADRSDTAAGVVGGAADAGRQVIVTVQASGVAPFETTLGMKESIRTLIERFGAVVGSKASAIRLKFDGDALDPETLLQVAVEDLDEDELEDGVRFDAYIE